MASGGGHIADHARQLEEEGVVRSNTTESRLIDRTTFQHVCLMATNQERAAQELQPYCGCGALRIQPLLADLCQLSLSDRKRKTVTIDVTSPLPAALLTPAQHRVLGMLLPLILFLLLFHGFELF